LKKVTPISSRKADHIRINLEESIRSGLTTGLEHYHFIHRALPELNLNDVDLNLQLFGRTLHAPILISSMTGGNDEAMVINQTLASSAQETGVALGLGSQRAAIEHPELAYTFKVRHLAPDVLLFANLGAIQLNYGYSLEQCLKAVEMIEADALIFHFNPLQEALQSEGNTNFSGILKKVEKICHSLSIPVIAKEVGWGFSEQDIRLLKDIGIAAIDVAGAGGTSWSQVEMHRAGDEYQAQLAAAFVDWGIPTSKVIIDVRNIAPELEIFASGGLRSGVDIAKCIALGATLGGMANPFLKAVSRSPEATIQTIKEIQREIQICMFAAGVRNLNALRTIELAYD